MSIWIGSGSALILAPLNLRDAAVLLVEEPAALACRRPRLARAASDIDVDVGHRLHVPLAHVQVELAGLAVELDVHLAHA
eukprot:5831030-Alexandrium_andersonii.AAC.1